MKKRMILSFVILLLISGCSVQEQQKEIIEETIDQDLPPAPPSDSKIEELSESEIPPFPLDDIPENSLDSSLTVSPQFSEKENLNVPQEFVGLWRVYSSRLFYDSGGGGSIGTDSSTKLELQNNGKWNYGSSSGTWKTELINSNDWGKWQIESYGPTRKLILNEWKGSIADGPVEESNNIDFLWVIYRSEPPLTSAPGTVNMKFGH